MTVTLAPPEIFLRLFLATLVGVLLGITRDLESKPTGMRTLGLVGLGAAAITVAGAYLAIIQTDANAISRVLQGLIQGVLTGVGFLGAGAVIRRQSSGDIHGLTTAANVLVVASLGIASGIGAWWVVLIAGVLAFILLVVMHPLERRIELYGRKRTPPQPPEKS